MRRHLSLLSAVALAVALPACSGSDTPTSRGGPVRVGAVLAMSGDDAALGISQQRAIEIAAATLRKPRLEVTYGDEAGDPTLGTQAVARHVAAGVVVVVGPTHSNVARAAYGEVDVEEVPMLGISMTVPGLTAFRPYLWRSSLAGDRVVPAAVRDAVMRLRPRSAMVIGTTNDLLTQAETELFRDGLGELGVAVLGELTFPRGQRDVSQVVAEVRRQQPELLCIAALVGDGSRLLRELRAAGVTTPVVGGNGFNSASLLGPDAEGLTVGSAWSIDSPDPASVRFVNAFRAEHGIDPDQFAAQAYAGMEVLHAAARAGGSSSAGIQRALGRLGPVETVLGELTFDFNRDAVHRPWVRVVTSGAFITRRL